MMGNFHPQIIESGASLSEAYSLFLKEMLDMLDRVALKKMLRQQTDQNMCDTILSSGTNITLSQTEKKWKRYRQDHQCKVYEIERSIYNMPFLQTTKSRNLYAKLNEVKKTPKTLQNNKEYNQ